MVSRWRVTTQLRLDPQLALEAIHDRDQELH